MDPAESGPAPQRCRSYLHLVAQLNCNPRLQAKLDASDLVQQTMLQAHQGIAQFRGKEEPELRAWLSQILARNLAHATRDFGRDKRDIGRERSIEESLDDSSVRIVNWLIAEQPSPSQKFEREEQIARLADALAELPDAQQEAAQKILI